MTSIILLLSFAWQYETLGQLDREERWYPKSENVLLGGYVADHPNTPYIDKGTPVIITYKNSIKISLPLNESKLYKKHNFEWGEKWIMIGLCDYYISK